MAEDMLFSIRMNTSEEICLYILHKDLCEKSKEEIKSFTKKNNIEKVSWPLSWPENLNKNEED